MNAPAEIIDRILAAPRGGRFSASAARLRQVATLAQIIRTVDAVLEEAADAKIAAPGFLEIREWAAHGIEELVEAAERNMASMAEAA